MNQSDVLFIIILLLTYLYFSLFFFSSVSTSVIGSAVAVSSSLVVPLPYVVIAVDFISYHLGLLFLGFSFTLIILQNLVRVFV